MKMDFDPKLMAWIRQCITTITYSVSMNGELVGPISQRLGLRQGDPLSPYLFIIRTKGLSGLLKPSSTERGTSWEQKLLTSFLQMTVCSFLKQKRKSAKP